MPSETHTLTGRDEVSAALADETLTVPAVPADTADAGIRWLRATVARFSEGTVHTRRRRLVTEALAGIRPARLRHDAGDRVTAAADPAGAAQTVPVRLLAEALLPTVSSGIEDDVAAVAGAYQPHLPVTGRADRAVARLVSAFGGAADERTAALIGLLVQACDATAGLVGNALRAAKGRPPDCPVETIIAETLRHDPPVRGTVRLTTSGDAVALDLAASGLAFGAGRHECPGREHALAIATGIVDALVHR